MLFSQSWRFQVQVVQVIVIVKFELTTKVIDKKKYYIHRIKYIILRKTEK